MCLLLLFYIFILLLIIYWSVSGYYGDALSDRKEDGCKLCQCYPPGTLELDDGRVAPCDQLTGHCACKPHVVGRNCDKCEEGYYHIMSGEVKSIKIVEIIIF